MRFKCTEWCCMSLCCLLQCCLLYSKNDTFVVISNSPLSFNNCHQDHRCDDDALIYNPFTYHLHLLSSAKTLLHTKFVQDALAWKISRDGIYITAKSYNFFWLVELRDCWENRISWIWGVIIIIFKKFIFKKLLTNSFKIE